MTTRSPITYRRLLVPLDGSTLAEAVLPATASIAQRADGEVTLIHVLEVRAPTTIHGEKHLMGADDAAAYLQSVAERLRSAGVAVQTHVHEAREGDIPRSIAEHAAEFEPDLVALCAHGPGGLRGLVNGRIGQQVLARGSWPILLIQSGPKSHAPTFDLKRIAVPVDGTVEHEGGLDAAIPLAELFGAELRMLYVVPTVGTVSGERAHSAVLLPTAMRAILEMARESGLKYLEGIATNVRQQGLRAEGEVLRGQTVSELLSRASKLSVDLIVVASHGRAGLAAFLTGSVGSKLLTRAKGPLLLVRAGDP